MIQLICSDCQHANEPERIYCHNCGARLDRTKVIKEKVKTDESEATTQRHLKKMLDPRRGRSKAILLKFFKLLAGALVTAAVVVMLLPPADIPPEKKTFDFAPMISMDLMTVTSSSQPAALVYSEDQVNNYLVSALRNKSSHAAEGYFPLRRVTVNFREDACGVNIQRQLFALSIYSGGSYEVRLVNGKIVTRTLGGYIGRMPIHPSLMQATELLLQKAWTALERERKSVGRLSKIEFHPQSVTLIAGR